MSKETISEGSATLDVHTEKVISKKLPVFYNPAMKSNRDLTILFLNACKKEGLVMCDLMAGSGIRSIRFLKELRPEVIKELIINDANPSAVQMIEKNLKKNGCLTKKVVLRSHNADRLLADKGAYHYIDVDPFGSPNPFLDLAIKKILPKGILAITATDTAPLCGTYPKACRRKYWAEPSRGPNKHEFATRILIRKAQLVAAQYDKALIPQCVIAIRHYIRIFFEVKKGKTEVDKILKLHDMHEGIGPIYTGPLHDPVIIKSMAENAPNELKKFLNTLSEESNIETIGFHDIHVLAKETRLPIPKFERIINELQNKGFQASRSIFSEEGIRTDAPTEELKKIMKKNPQ